MALWHWTLGSGIALGLLIGWTIRGWLRKS
jgi:hypothetical protein